MTNHRNIIQLTRLLLSSTILLAAAAGAQALAPEPGEMESARTFASGQLLSADASKLPFSFVYGGKGSAELLKSWPRTIRGEKLDDARTKTTIEWSDPGSGLRVRCEAVEYKDFPTVEWTLYFRNAGSEPTATLEQVQALDAAWQRAGSEEFLLHHAVGSPANKNDYAPRQTPLPPKASKRIAAAGGRPTNSDWSYFNLEWTAGRKGVILVVGWPGQWEAQFVRDDAAGLRIRAGQEQVRTRLLAGEEIRSPLMVLQFWQGEYLRSQNLWRRWMMAHSMPKPGGQLPPPQFVASSSRAYEEMIHANEANQIMHIDRYLEEGLKLDYWWMDAGWYVQEKGWPQVGTWEVDPRRFPRGLRPISDHAHSKGMKIVVWFEPERVTPGTWLYENHPEWLLRAGPNPGGTDGLRSWAPKDAGEPAVTHNPTTQPRTSAEIVWAPGQLSFHPGPKGEYSAVRWTAAQAGTCEVQAAFTAIDKKTTTDVHVLAGGRAVHDGWLDLHGQGRKSDYTGKLDLKQGDHIDFVVGFGNGNFVCDSTGLEARIKSPGGQAYDAAKDFNPDKNPAGAWSYGRLQAAAAPDAGTFRLYDRPRRAGADDTRLLDMGNPQARAWLTEHVDKLLISQGIDLYRQDFNIDPLGFWRSADGPERQGMTENKYVCGFLAYWDELRRRHPNLLIDACASGGRRNDLESMRRAVPLWRSDYAFEPIGHQCMTYGLSLWLPYHGTGTVACANAGYYGGGKTPVEPYAFWSNTAPSLGSGIDLRVKDIDYKALRELIAQWRQLSRFYYGDFYPLTPYTQDNREWIAWQFNDPEHGQAAIQAFRRAQCDKPNVRLKLYDLAPDITYVVTTIGEGGGAAATQPSGQGPANQGPASQGRFTGRQLMSDGLSVTLPAQPAAAVILLKAEKLGS